MKYRKQIQPAGRVDPGSFSAANLFGRPPPDGSFRNAGADI